MASTTAAPESHQPLTKTVVEKTVASQFKANPKDVEVTNYEVSAGTSIGDNFTSDVKQVEVEAVVHGRQHQLSYIAKLKEPNNLRMQLFAADGVDIFAVECAVYRSLLPKMKKLREDAGLPPMTVPDAYYVSPEDGVLVFHNLKRDGYRVPAKSASGMADDCTEDMIKKLAEFHATGHHLIQRQSGGAEQFLKDEPMFKTRNLYASTFGDAVEQVSGVMFDNIANFLKDAADRPYLAEKLLQQKPCWRKKAVSSCWPAQGAFLTLVHGDAWYHNTLVKFKEDGRLESQVLLDFQEVNVGNVGCDLALLVHMNAFPSARKKQIDGWLRLYHETFSHNLAAFGEPEMPFSMEELQNDYRHALYYVFVNELGIIATLIPGAISSEEGAKMDWQESFEGSIAATSTLAQVVNSVPHLLERITGIVSNADEDGLL